jgi:cobalt transporter subunit CbtA
MFRRIFLTALIAGAVAGLCVAGIQRLQIIPLIEQAEVYEVAETHPGHAGMTPSGPWQPGAGFERAAFTVAADVLTGIGFALLLTGAIALAAQRGHRVDVRRGLVWGAAGFAVFTLAPSLGLPPSLPGSETAELIERQAWWAGTAIATAFGLGIIVFVPVLLYRAIGVALLVLPHAIGAPAPPGHGGGIPPELARSFVIASICTAGMFWLVLGAMSGWLYRRLEGA